MTDADQLAYAAGALEHIQRLARRGQNEPEKLLAAIGQASEYALARLQGIEPAGFALPAEPEPATVSAEDVMEGLRAIYGEMQRIKNRLRIQKRLG